MRVRGTVIICVALAASMGLAEDPVQPWWKTSLQHGTLTVWMVTRATTDDKLRIGRERLTAAIQPSKVSVEKTMGEFGTASSNAGQTSSTYGQTSGSFGTSASNVGQNAGSAGKSPSELGTSSSTYGQTSSSYGQTAGSFGQTAGSYGTVASDSNKPQAVARQVQDTQQRGVESSLRYAFPGLTVHVVNVADLELKERLADVKGTEAYPDAIIGVQYLDWWWQSGLGVTMLGELVVTDGRAKGNDGPYLPGTIDLVRDGPHGDAARAFWVWISDAMRCQDCGGDGTAIAAEVPVPLAQAALRHVLSGTPLGADADKDAAEFGPQEAAGMALAAFSRGGQGGADQKIQMQTISGFVSGRLSAVSLQAVISSADSYGVLDALVVMHKGDDGRWKVLQITPSTRSDRRGELYQDLRSATLGKAATAALLPVSLASPQDGETRTEHPELWWDNGGQARLQVVEWQTSQAGVWTASQLLPVVDIDAHVQTRVTASFARDGSRYRWRVWSVGRGGTLAITPWSGFSVLGH